MAGGTLESLNDAPKPRQPCKRQAERYRENEVRMQKERQKQFFNSLLVPFLAILTGLLFAAILILFTDTLRWWHSRNCSPPVLAAAQ